MLCEHIVYIWDIYKYIGVCKILRFPGEDESGRATTSVFIFEES